MVRATDAEKEVQIAHFINYIELRLIYTVTKCAPEKSCEMQARIIITERRDFSIKCPPLDLMEFGKKSHNNAAACALALIRPEL